MPGRLEINLLGNVEILRDGAPITGFRSGKAKALLCYLAVTGHAHQRLVLADLLWGDMPEAKSNVNLRQTLSNLRK